MSQRLEILQRIVDARRRQLAEGQRCGTGISEHDLIDLQVAVLQAELALEDAKAQKDIANASANNNNILS